MGPSLQDRAYGAELHRVKTPQQGCCRRFPQAIWWLTYN